MKILKFKFLSKVILFSVLLTAFCFVKDIKSQDFSKEEIAYYWAPVWYQDTEDSNYQADFLTRFDYDDNWIGDDNWENVGIYPLEAFIYYSFIETETHLFIGYYSFHPRDWDIINSDSVSHENDLEGVLIVVKKDNSWGQFLCMVTRAHQNFYQYKDNDQIPSSEISGGHEDLDGDVEFETVAEYESSFSFDSHEHPIIYIESKGHAVYGSERWEIEGFPGGNGVKYFPKGISEEPSSGNDRDVSYKLIGINDLWQKRFETYGSGETFGSFVALDGDTYGVDKALAPWGWDDNDDGATFTGEIFYNPVDLVNTHFNNLGIYEYTYTYNPYAVILKFDEYRAMEDRDLGKNDYSDGYFNLYMFDGDGRYEWTSYKDGVLDGDSGTQDSWVEENMITEQWYPLELKRPLYGLRYPKKPFFGIRSMDWDDYQTDQWLMDTEFIHWYGDYTSTLPDDGVEYTISDGFQELRWGKSEVRFYLFIENEDFISFSNTTTSSVNSNFQIIPVFLLLIASAINLEKRKKKTKNN